MGGLTTPANLVTLCLTCHTGLDPHFDFNLYGCVKLPRDPIAELLDNQAYEQTKGIEVYRKKVASAFAKAEKARSKANGGARQPKHAAPVKSQLL